MMRSEPCLELANLGKLEVGLLERAGEMPSSAAASGTRSWSRCFYGQYKVDCDVYLVDNDHADPIILDGDVVLV
jgi:hypothetical protein